MDEAEKAMQTPGVYAIFRVEDEDEEDRRVDKGYWGGLVEEEE